MSEVIVHRPTPFFLPAEDAFARQFLEPRSHHSGRAPLDETDYAEYERHTLFHDVFLAGGEIRALGPPLLNLERVVSPIRCHLILPDGTPSTPLPHRVVRRERCALHRFRLPPARRGDACVSARIELASGHTVRVEPRRVELARVFLQFATLQKDNPFVWIADWLGYARRLGVDRVLLYDNGSADIADLPERLRALEEVPDIVLVHWPFAYGPTRSYRNRFAQASQINHAHECFGASDWCGHFDIDEYPVADEGIGLREYLVDRPARTGMLRLDSWWSPRTESGTGAGDDAPPELPCAVSPDDAASVLTARDLTYRERTPRGKAHKYLVRTAALREPRVHNARLRFGWLRQRPAPDTLAFVHFVALSRDWKGWGRTAAVPLDPAVHVAESRVARLLETLPIPPEPGEPDVRRDPRADTGTDRSTLR